MEGRYGVDIGYRAYVQDWACLVISSARQMEVWRAAVALTCTQISPLCNHMHNRAIPLNVMCALSLSACAL